MFEDLFSHLSKDIAIDLGTANSLVYVRGQGIVISEPSVVAVNEKTGQVLAIGKEAKRMVGRTPSHIVASRPLSKGVISDFEVAEQMLSYFIDKVHQKKFLLGPRPRVIIGIPCGVTEVEKKSVADAAENAGTRKVFLIEQPMAAAIGSRLPVQGPGGNLIIDIGGGTTEVAVISLGGIVNSKSLRVAGDQMNQDIIDFAQQEYKLLIGERTAERIKVGIGSAMPLDEEKEMSMRGRNLVSGLPEEITITDTEVREAMKKSIDEIISEVKATIEATPPELLADIMSRGIHLAGGGAQVRRLDELIQEKTKIPTEVVEDSLTTVARGGGEVIEHIDELQEVLVEPEYQEPPSE